MLNYALVSLLQEGRSTAPAGAIRLKIPLTLIERGPLNFGQGIALKVAIRDQRSTIIRKVGAAIGRRRFFPDRSWVAVIVKTQDGGFKSPGIRRG
jgi:hypothetical protein